MRNIFYLAFGLLVFVCCSENKYEENTQAKGFVLSGVVGDLNSPSQAYLSYKVNDSTVYDSATIENGRFKFEGEVEEPVAASIWVRHGDSIPEKSWHRDNISFYLENADMKITSEDSVKKAEVSGSTLNDESIEFYGKLQPMTGKVREISLRLQGKPQDEAYMQSVDTIRQLQRDVDTLLVTFVSSHKNSYMGMLVFNQYQLGYNFDPNVREKEFNEFDEELRGSQLGQKTLDKINVAKRSEEGAKVSDFTIENLEGEPFTFSSLKGDYVLLEFWASWCKPCRAENPNLKKIYSKLQDQNFEIVGISLDESKKPWENAIEKDELPWIHISQLRGFKSDIAKHYGITAIPQNMLVDPEGIIIAKNLRGEDLATRLSEIFKN
ncbi:TlpA disulfide reductase family protein [Fulvivirga ligni]|uniref:TlpA disulfide reductase family protein n=1 Tax=Fulvivirga ligni TaxID=2904246 RepID=UPI001F390B80|nr:TlpA disulfide reductase family protein [Fulvivirga ligni]UII19009.1 AhpC/TSA family protein [Fulvivirga ligni]